MTVTTRTSLAVAALAIVAVTTAALASAPAQNAIAAAKHVVSTVSRVAFASVHAQNTSGGPGPFMGRGRGGPGGFGRFGGPQGRGGPMGELGPINRLDLTDAQRDQIKGVVDASRDDTKALADRARTTHQALHAAVTADNFDEGAIRAASAQVASVEADMAVARAKRHAHILQILTPEQRTQLNALQTQMQERRQERRPPGR